MDFEEGMLVAILPGSSGIRIVCQPVEKLPYRLGIIQCRDWSFYRWRVRIEGENRLWSVRERDMKALLPCPLPTESQALTPLEAFQKHLPEIICALAFSIQ